MSERLDYSGIKVCKKTGRRYVMNGIRKWGAMYYSCDGFHTQSTSMSEAKESAIAAGSMSWLQDKNKGTLAIPPTGKFDPRQTTTATSNSSAPTWRRR